MEEYPSNSFRSRREKDEEAKRPKIEPVVLEGRVTRKPPSFGQKLKENLTAGDPVQSIGDYVMFDVILPGAKRMVVSIFQEAVEMLILGRSTGVVGRHRTRVFDGSSGRTRYNEISRSMPKKAREQHDFDSIVLEDRGEAELVLDNLVTYLDEYGAVSVYDLYELCGVTGEPTDKSWGWTNLDSVSTSKVHDGYLLNLPTPRYFKKGE